MDTAAAAGGGERQVGREEDEETGALRKHTVGQGEQRHSHE